MLSRYKAESAAHAMALLDGGMDAAGAAKETGVPEGCVRRWARRREICGDPMRPLRYEEVVAYQREMPGADYGRIADELGVHRTTVSSLMIRHGERKSVPKGMFDEKIEKFFAEHPEATNKEIGAEFGIAAGKVSYVLHRKGIRRTKNQRALTRDRLAEFMAERPNATYDEIARHFKVGLHIVRERLTAIGLTKAERLVMRDPELERLVGEHPEYTHRDLARELRVSLRTVSRGLSRLGLQDYWRDGRRAEFKKRQKKEMKELLARIREKRKRREVPEWWFNDETPPAAKRHIFPAALPQPEAWPMDGAPKLRESIHPWHPA